MADIVRIRTKIDRLRADQAAILRQALLPFADGEMSAQVKGLIGQIDRQTASDRGWTFIMLSPEQFGIVVDFLATRSTRPIVAMRMWALFFRHLNHDTGEIALSRDEIASAVGETPDHVSTIMSELVAVGAVIRQRERIAGMRGPGRMRYFVNPRVATHLAGQQRDQAQRSASPILKLV